MELNECFELKKKDNRNFDAYVISNLSNGDFHLYWTGSPTFHSNDK
jgi:hypothetical protein